MLWQNRSTAIEVGDEFDGLGTLRFPVECFTARFDELSTRTGRRADIDLYLDLLTDDLGVAACDQNRAVETCGHVSVLDAARQIDDELPGF